MARRSRIFGRLRVMGGLTLLAGSIAACSLLAGLTEDYRVNPDGSTGPTSEAGGDGPGDPDGSDLDGSIPTDGGMDAPEVAPPLPGSFCDLAMDAGDAGPYAYCWDFELPGATPPKWGWDDEEHQYGTVTVQPSIGFNNSRGLHTTITNPGVDGGGGKTYLRKAVGLGSFTDYHKHELSFRFLVTKASTGIYGAALGTIGISDAAALKYTGVEVYTNGGANSLDVSDPPGSLSVPNVSVGSATTWHTAMITMQRDDDASTTYTTSVKIDSMVVDSTPFVGVVGQTQINIGTFFTDAADGGVEVVIDDVLVRQTK